jgi:hypothetical protein
VEPAVITNQTGPQPADFADVRATNLAVVLRYMRMHAPCSRADIASTTGLNKSTVSSLVADLIDRRLVREIGMTEARVGRPATMLVLDGSAYAAIGCRGGGPFPGRHRIRDKRPRRSAPSSNVPSPK